MSEAPNTVSEVVVTGPSSGPAPAQHGVTVYSPQVSVVIKKAINRKATVAQDVPVAKRVQGTEGTEIDLTPFLAVGTTVTVHRTVRGADSGMWSVNFPDQMHPLLADSIYGLVEPQDVVEIRMARDPSKFAGGELPIVLRGFVSNVGRSEMMTPNGPQRSVTISGHDYSKVLNLIRFIYLPTMIPAQLLLSSFKMFLNYGVDSTGYDSPAAFVTKVVTEVVGEFLEKMKGGSGGSASPVVSLSVDATDSDTSFAIQPFGVQDWDGGNVYDLLASFGDVGAWNELYVEDREDGPFVVFRPTPFRTAAGDYVQSGASADAVSISASDVVTLAVERADANVANYFWVDMPRLTLLQNPLVQMDQTLEPSPSITDYQNADPAIYGVRLMRVSSQEGIRYDGQSESDVDDGQAKVLAEVSAKRQTLIDNNKDNAVWETGTMTLKGDEALKPGCYLNLDRGGFKASFYAFDMTHQFTIGGAFLTIASVERGTGFIERVQRGARAPAYLAELTAGGSYG